jgi:hypothetical protein
MLNLRVHHVKFKDLEMSKFESMGYNVSNKYDFSLFINLMHALVSINPLFLKLCCVQKATLWGKHVLQSLIMNLAICLHFLLGWSESNFGIKHCNFSHLLFVITNHKDACWSYMNAKCDTIDFWFVSKYMFHIGFLFLTPWTIGLHSKPWWRWHYVEVIPHSSNT